MPTTQQVILPQLQLISWQSKGYVQSQTQVQGCGQTYRVHALHISLTFIFVVHRYKSSVTKLYIHTVCRDALSNAHFLCDTAAGLGDTVQRVSPISKYRL